MANLNNIMQSLTFENIYLLTQGLKIDSNTADSRGMVTFFKLFFNVEANDYISSCFKRYDFLKAPVYTSTYERKKTSDKVKKVFFTNSEASNCIVSQMGFDSINLYSLFNKVEKYFKRQMDDIDAVKNVLETYDQEYIRQNFRLIEEFHTNNDSYNHKEITLLHRYWDLYIQLINHSHICMALSLLLLYSVINAEVIHIVPYVEKTVKYNYETPVTDLNQLIGEKFVIRSALSSQLFLAHKESHEPLSEEDTNAHARKMLFTVPQTRLNIDNAIFKIEEADPNDKEVEPDDNTLGGRSIEVVNKTTTEIMKLLIPLGVIVSDVIKDRKNTPRYYIKAIVGDEEYYMQYIDWFKNSKIIFSNERTKKRSWFIEQDKNNPKYFKICPYGDTQYHLLALDIPNATTKTFNIPLWLFPGNKTKAQRFMFYRVID